jgi:hypothetical protein
MKFTSKHIVLMTAAIILLPEIICALNEFEYQPANFNQITLANISSQSEVREGSFSITILINDTDDNAVITADNSETARLTNGTDTLVTEYKLTLDGDGTAHTNKSGGTSMTEYAAYDSFLTGGLNIQRIAGDNDIVVTLSVRASNRPGNACDAGTYTATQTLTVAWDGL